MSSCSCVNVYSGDYDGPSVCSINIVKARKEHKCCECRRIINRGEQYERTKGLWDGTWSKYNMCIDCASVVRAFFCDGGMYETIWEDLAESFRDSAGKFDPNCLVDLTPIARSKVCDLIESCWKD